MQHQCRNVSNIEYTQLSIRYQKRKKKWPAFSRIKITWHFKPSEDVQEILG